MKFFGLTIFQHKVLNWIWIYLVKILKWLYSWGLSQNFVLFHFCFVKVTCILKNPLSTYFYNVKFENNCMVMNNILSLIIYVKIFNI